MKQKEKEKNKKMSNLKGGLTFFYFIFKITFYYFRKIYECYIYTKL